MERRARLWLCLPPLLLLLIDAALTLYGQPDGYWQGDFLLRREMNPVFDRLLSWRPAAFLGGCAAWGILITLVVVFSPRRVAFLAALACSLGHTCGAASWLVQAGTTGWALALLLLLAASQVFWWAARRSGA